MTQKRTPSVSKSARSLIEEIRLVHHHRPVESLGLHGPKLTLPSTTPEEVGLRHRAGLDAEIQAKYGLPYVDRPEDHRLSRCRRLPAAEDAGRGGGPPPAVLIREAVSEYAARRLPLRKPKSVGAGRSGRRDLSERAEELLTGLGRPR